MTDIPPVPRPNDDETDAARRPASVRPRRRAMGMTLAGAAAIAPLAPGARAATAPPTTARPDARLRTGWILRPDDA